ncbi:MAG TPA: hypothetical protein VIY73_09940, partial [Polyangiaceae bacterium]
MVRSGKVRGLGRAAVAVVVALAAWAGPATARADGKAQPEASGHASAKGEAVAVVVEGAHADVVAGWIEDRVRAPDTLKNGDVFHGVLGAKGALPLRRAADSAVRDVDLLVRTRAAAKEAGVDRAILVDVRKTPHATRIHVWHIDADSGSALVDSDVTLPPSATAIEESRVVLALAP